MSSGRLPVKYRGAYRVIDVMVHAQRFLVLYIETVLTLVDVSVRTATTTSNPKALLDLVLMNDAVDSWELKFDRALSTNVAAGLSGPTRQQLQMYMKSVSAFAKERASKIVWQIRTVDGPLTVRCVRKFSTRNKWKMNYIHRQCWWKKEIKWKGRMEEKRTDGRSVTIETIFYGKLTCLSRVEIKFSQFFIDRSEEWIFFVDESRDVDSIAMWWERASWNR